MNIPDEIIEEAKATFTEGEFASRMTIIETFHAVGRLLAPYKLTGLNSQLQKVAKQIGKSERTLYYAVKFYDLYPDLNLLPEAKNTSMRTIIRKYLTTPQEEAEHAHSPIVICSSCKKKLDLLPMIDNDE